MQQRRSKAQLALDWMASDSKRSVAEAAQQFGITYQAVFNLQKRLETKPVCPCCGQFIKTVKE